MFKKSTGSSSLSGNKRSIKFVLTEDNDLVNDYHEIRRMHHSAEFIPSEIIPTILAYHFDQVAVAMTFSPDHAVYKIKIKYLLQDAVKNWEYNRQPDMVRCPDIARYITVAKKPIDTMFYMTYNNPKDQFEVLDGIHRITALKLIKEDSMPDLDLIEWLLEQEVLVNIRFNATFGQLIEVFTNLNKSQPVPELYIRDQKKERRDTIEAIANEWAVMYKKHFSSASNPICGNTNRNKFIDLLDKLYDKHNIGEYGSGIRKLRKLLSEANTLISRNIPPKASVDVRVKCRESGCYLFLLKNDELEHVI